VIAGARASELIAAREDRCASPRTDEDPREL